MVHCSISLS